MDSIKFIYPSPIGLLNISFDNKGIYRINFLNDEENIIEEDRALFCQTNRESVFYKLHFNQFNEYFAGQRIFFEIPIKLVGTPFQKMVWQEVLKIPFAETKSYGQIARLLGKPGAARAVGMAMNRNPLPIIIPCHRVIGSNGSLTGYASGIWRKRWLLDHEKNNERIGEKYGHRITTTK